ncbi:D-glycero-beta-D-manno-heptose 1-phosphate adenylyltransferase [uncultured Oscillibacter sp.]|nr:D-glycero-beta-D-manno-heptose 1-phosphate adenylyltransferase [uncultured Oscillibacter sp.]
MVIGDFMIDRYFQGDVHRISPEAPVPIFLKQDEYFVLGGASNVVSNLASAGQNVVAVSVIGRDATGDTLIAMLEDLGCNTSGVIRDIGRKTITKTRILAKNHQQLLRIDEESTERISTEDEKEIIRFVQREMARADLLILSDYAKGVLTPSVCQEAIKTAKEYDVPVFIDIKDAEIEKYAGATLLKPNRKELETAAGAPLKTKADLRGAAHSLCDICGADYVLTTLGSEGMLLIGNGIEKQINSSRREVYDVSGAGDTVISYLAACYANRMDITTSAMIANCAAGIKVTKMGTAPVSIHEVSREWCGEQSSKDLYGRTSKVLSLSELTGSLKHRPTETVVFTNGCFDILHLGHIGYLRQAASFGDILVVGVNSDASVKRLKKESRPINNEHDRTELLAALEFVDYVVLFDEDTPMELIRQIRPDVLVKGGDYTKEEVVGADLVAGDGGRVEIVPYLENHSTTDIIRKIERGDHGGDAGS